MCSSCSSHTSYACIVVRRSFENPAAFILGLILRLAFDRFLFFFSYIQYVYFQFVLPQRLSLAVFESGFNSERKSSYFAVQFFFFLNLFFFLRPNLLVHMFMVFMYVPALYINKISIKLQCFFFVFTTD